MSETVKSNNNRGSKKSSTLGGRGTSTTIISSNETDGNENSSKKNGHHRPSSSLFRKSSTISRTQEPTNLPEENSLKKSRSLMNVLRSKLNSPSVLRRFRSKSRESTKANVTEIDGQEELPSTEHEQLPSSTTRKSRKRDPSPMRRLANRISQFTRHHRTTSNDRQNKSPSKSTTIDSYDDEKRKSPSPARNQEDIKRINEDYEKIQAKYFNNKTLIQRNSSNDDAQDRSISTISMNGSLLSNDFFNNSQRLSSPLPPEDPLLQARKQANLKLNCMLSGYSLTRSFANHEKVFGQHDLFKFNHYYDVGTRKYDWNSTNNNNRMFASMRTRPISKSIDSFRTTTTTENPTSVTIEKLNSLIQADNYDNELVIREDRDLLRSKKAEDTTNTTTTHPQPTSNEHDEEFERSFSRAVDRALKVANSDRKDVVGDKVVESKETNLNLMQMTEQALSSLNNSLLFTDDQQKNDIKVDDLSNNLDNEKRKEEEQLQSTNANIIHEVDQSSINISTKKQEEQQLSNVDLIDKVNQPSNNVTNENQEQHQSTHADSIDKADESSNNITTSQDATTENQAQLQSINTDEPTNNITKKNQEVEEHEQPTKVDESSKNVTTEHQTQLQSINATELSNNVTNNNEEVKQQQPSINADDLLNTITTDNQDKQQTVNVDESLKDIANEKQNELQSINTDKPTNIVTNKTEEVEQQQEQQSSNVDKPSENVTNENEDKQQTINVGEPLKDISNENQAQLHSINTNEPANNVTNKTEVEQKQQSSNVDKPSENVTNENEDKQQTINVGEPLKDISNENQAQLHSINTNEPANNVTNKTEEVEQKQQQSSNVDKPSENITDEDQEKQQTVNVDASLKDITIEKQSELQSINANEPTDTVTNKTEKVEQQPTNVNKSSENVTNEDQEKQPTVHVDEPSNNVTNKTEEVEQQQQQQSANVDKPSELVTNETEEKQPAVRIDEPSKDITNERQSEPQSSNASEPTDAVANKTDEVEQKQQTTDLDELWKGITNENQEQQQSINVDKPSNVVTNKNQEDEQSIPTDSIDKEIWLLLDELLDQIEDTKTGQEFLVKLDEEEKIIKSKADSYNKFLQSDDQRLTEEVCTDINAVIGEVNLLLRGKLKQFRGLCQANVTNFNNGQPIPLDSDLEGFWDITYPLIDKVKEKFTKLDVRKSKQWALIEEYDPNDVNNRLKPLQPHQAKSSRIPVIKSANDDLKKLIQERRKAAAAHSTNQNQDIEIFFGPK